MLENELAKIEKAIRMLVSDYLYDDETVTKLFRKRETILIKLYELKNT